MQNLSDNELLNAYIDGELTLSDRDQCLQRLNTELGFRRQYKALLEANEHYCRSVDEIDGRDYSEEIINLLQPEHEAHNSSGLWSRSNFLVAAVLLMVILPMSFFYLDTQHSTFEHQLHAVLTTQGSGEVVEYEESQTKFYVTLSFVNKNGQVCREFHYQHVDRSAQSVGCYTDNDWQIVAEAEMPWIVQNDAYMPASAEQNDVIENYIEDNIASDILTYEQEQTALKRLNN